MCGIWFVWGWILEISDVTLTVPVSRRSGALLQGTTPQTFADEQALIAISQKTTGCSWIPRGLLSSSYCCDER